MKRFLISAAFALSLFALAPAAFAASCTDPSDQASCGTGNICQQDANGFYACVPAGTASGTCSGRDDTSCGDGKSCQQDANGFYGCFSNAGSALTGSPGANTNPTGFVPLAPIPGLTDNQSNISASSLAVFFNNLYKYLIGIAAILAVVQIIRSGIEIATNQENVSKILDSKGRITQAILGLVLILLPALVFSIINPSILNLSINLEPLPTASGNAGGTPSSGTPAAQTTTANGVTQSISGSVLQTATFSSNDPDKNNAAAQAWVSTCNSGGKKAYLTSGSAGSQQQVTSSGSTYTAASSAIAYCSSYSSALQFINENGAYDLSAVKLRPLTGSNTTGAQSFRNSCASDGGKLCIPVHAPGNAAGANPGSNALPACPSGTNESLGSGSSGKCYQAYLFCSPAQSTSDCGSNPVTDIP